MDFGGASLCPGCVRAAEQARQAHAAERAAAETRRREQSRFEALPVEQIARTGVRQKSASEVEASRRNWPSERPLRERW
jgi:hypothetical protein